MRSDETNIGIPSGFSEPLYRNIASSDNVGGVSYTR